MGRKKNQALVLTSPVSLMVRRRRVPITADQIKIARRKIIIGKTTINTNRDYALSFQCGNQGVIKTAFVRFREDVTVQEVIKIFSNVGDIKCDESCRSCEKMAISFGPVVGRFA